MTMVSEAVASNYKATLYCEAKNVDRLQCSSIEHEICNKGKDIIPGVYQCITHYDSGYVVVDVEYSSAIDKEDIKSRLYALVYLLSALGPGLDGLSVQKITVKNINESGL